MDKVQGARAGDGDEEGGAAFGTALYEAGRVQHLLHKVLHETTYL